MLASPRSSDLLRIGGGNEREMQVAIVYGILMAFLAVFGTWPVMQLGTAALARGLHATWRLLESYGPSSIVRVAEYMLQ